ncbi:MAG: malate/lactate/ureidoglycolate dehydrogenase [Alphaproteobacteria bacterium]|nr:malate/lactate/ureidoglycolate dehydrogenase [Alphaproteobacteria bacterium]
MRRFPADHLEAFSESVLAALGSSPDEARAVSSHLVGANLAGHDSHGIALLATYAKHARAGLVRPNAKTETIQDTPAILQIDGCDGFGAVVGHAAAARACEKAKHAGVCALTVGRTHHLGRIGAFGERAADAGCVFIAFVNVVDHAGLVAPFRGADARFGTNPICIALPGSAAHDPFLLDMATSWLALGKVREAAAKGEAVPFGSVLDAEGRPTDDPHGMGSHDYSSHVGALAFFGQHKGYALGFAAELLAGLLSGFGTIQPGNARRDGLRNAMFALVLDPSKFADPDWLARERDATIAYALASPPADPAAPVLAPGDAERLARAERMRDGVPLADAVIANLKELAATLALPDNRRL